MFLHALSTCKWSMVWFDVKIFKGDHLLWETFDLKQLKKKLHGPVNDYNRSNPTIICTYTKLSNYLV